MPGLAGPRAPLSSTLPSYEDSTSETALDQQRTGLRAFAGHFGGPALSHFDGGQPSTHPSEHMQTRIPQTTNNTHKPRKRGTKAPAAQRTRRQPDQLN